MTPYCHTLMLGYMSGFSAHRQGIRGEELVSLLPDTFSHLDVERKSSFSTT